MRPRVSPLATVGGTPDGCPAVRQNSPVPGAGECTQCNGYTGRFRVVCGLLSRDGLWSVLFGGAVWERG